jgi:hypothetical protein
MDRNEIVRLAIDTYKGKIDGNFSKTEGSKALIDALIEANGGSSKIDIKSLRRNKAEIFEIIEEVIPTLVQEGLQGDEFYQNFVDERRLAVGDTNDFIVEPNSTLVVSKIANGVATPRRQRIGEKSKISVDTYAHAVRIYEELNRVLAKRTDWTTFVDTVAKSYRTNFYNDIFTVFNGITSSTTGMNSTYYPAAGSYSENALSTIVDHVETANNKPAIIVGTKAALRNITTAVVSESAREDLYNFGVYGKFLGTPLLSIRNRHTVGTDTNILSDKKMYVLSADDKFIKAVFEGDALMSDKDPLTNADLSKEFLYIESYGISLVISSKIGVYEIS